MKINKAWLDSHEWMLRSSDNGVSYGDYRWKRKGAWNKAPDWNDKAKCGGGFHGIAPEAHGYGFDYRRIELHETRGKRITIDDKIKVPESRIVAVGGEIPAVAFKRCGINNILVKDVEKVNNGRWCILGSINIKKVVDSDLRFYDKSAVKIRVVTDGYMLSCDKSKITIKKVVGGSIYSEGKSTVIIGNMVEGKVGAYDESRIKIKNVIGDTAGFYNRSKIAIENIKNGYVEFCSDGKTTIKNVNGGYVEFHDNNRTTIKNVNGGSVWSYENSRITIENMTGGHIHSYGEYPIKIINDQRKKK